MNEEDEAGPEPTRFVALDVHKHYIMVGAVDARQTVVLPPRRVSWGEFPDWARAHLAATDAVVLEATANAWHLYDLLTPLVAAVTVAHAGLIKLIAQARVKTDRRDTLHLARLLAARLIPAVWVPPVEVRELRGLISHRRRLVCQRTQARNRLHAVLHRHQIVPPEGTLFSRQHRAWWTGLPLSAAERLRVRQDLAVPDDLLLLAQRNLQIARAAAQLPHGPGVVIANAAKWSWLDASGTPFDCQIVDEAFQLPDYRFQQIAGLARHVVLIGDPGQIDPIVNCEVERWRSDPAGPHVACPQALLARHPGVLRLALPVSRRLPHDTVRFVQPAFYPRLPFQALSAPGQRGIRTRLPGGQPLDGAIDLVEQGASLVQLQLPAQISGEVDEELAQVIVGLIDRLLQRGTTILDDGRAAALEPGMVGVVCGHISQVNAVRERLPARLAQVFVETSNRYQGLERPITLVHHPLSGRAEASEFHLDAGRLCVMLSRHRVACFVVARAGIEDILLRHAPSGERVLGIDTDAEYEGWKAHLLLQQALRSHQRVL